MRLCHLVSPVLLLTIAFLSGCSTDTKQNSAKLVPVSGTVTLDGQPLAGASVRFNPDQKTKGLAAYGVTDQDGKFELKDRGDRKGAPVGHFRVVITKLAMPDGSPIPKDMDAITAGATEQLPANYSDPTKTELTADVPEGGKTFEFKLVSKKK